tara:strand:+ start:423 stop:1790 length:1368 start_codon:yes stop_codon:yes gene_type:complete
MKPTITLKIIQKALLKECSSSHYVDDETSRRMWWSALEVIQQEFLVHHSNNGGLWVAAPLPALEEKSYLAKFQGWLFAPEGFPYFKNGLSKCLPYSQSHINNEQSEYTANYKIVNLDQNDGFEPFLMVITPTFQCVLTIAGEKNQKTLIMRNDKNILEKIVEFIDMRLSSENLADSIDFQNKLESLGALTPNDQFKNNFWPNLSIRLVKSIPNINYKISFKEHRTKTLQVSEAKLLEAISHEVRTPLSTIRTLISSTLKKYKMDETIKNRLIEIDNECTEQIVRFGLIFNAAELVNSESSSPQQLTGINLGEILIKLSPNWINQLKRRGIKLKLDIPNELPEVLSNSEGLELMLRGLIDKNTRGLNEGSSVTLELRPAGQKLKLQLIVHTKDDGRTKMIKSDGSDVGPVLNWNPQTGSLQLSQSATQKLLASLGGLVTQRKDSGLTVFFPIADIN